MTTPTPDPLAVAVNRVAALPDDFLAVLDAREFLAELARRVKAMQAEVTDRAVDLLRKSGPVVIGEVKYWAGPEVDWKPCDMRKIFAQVLETTGGDVDAMMGVLSTNAFKPGATRKMIGDDLFERVESWTMKDNEKRPKLIAVPVAILER